ncbi:hypothetical protein [Denitromonas sp.]|uniref:hypothetical protein n=1 Tax=Denitromonas sp. TaxID=2734609 RepID=UPI002AFEC43C|nr:hypothetical protein [Denitromonas sp.]
MAIARYNSRPFARIHRNTSRQRTRVARLPKGTLGNSPEATNAFSAGKVNPIIFANPRSISRSSVRA